MTKHDVDLFVIGAGSAGMRASRMAAGLGVKVAIAENRHVGGTCVNVGCVPKKLFVFAAQFATDFAAAKGFGWSLPQPEFTWRQLLVQKDLEIARLQSVYNDLLANSGVQLVYGQARILDPHTVAVDGQIFRAERILIASGARPSIPDFPGKEFVVTSDAMFALQTLPKRLLIVGGGYIAVEFAGIMQGLGVETVLSHRGDKLLRGFDEDIRDFTAQEMQKKGITIRFNDCIDHIERTPAGLLAHTAGQGTIEADLVLYATGRIANTAGLGLEELGVKLDDKGSIQVDPHYRTSVPSIYALGDVANRINLTPVATAEAMAFVSQCYAEQHRPLAYDNIPTAVFGQPNIGTVGLTEAEARRRYDNIDVYRSVFMPMKHALTGLNEKTLLKMVVDRDDNRVLGIHMVGADAGEIIQGMAVAIRAGATKAVFDSTIGIHPTVAEEFMTMRTPVEQ